MSEETPSLSCLAEDFILKNQYTLNNKVYIDSRQNHFKAALDNYCVYYIYSYMASCLLSSDQSIIMIDDLFNRLFVIKSYEKYIIALLSILSKNGYVKLGPDKVFFLDEPVTFALYELKVLYPRNVNFISFLEHCFINVSLVVSGKISALDVLYPDGSIRFLNSSLDEHSNGLSDMKTVIDRFIDILESIISVDSKIRILEVGGGRGLLSKRILEFIKACNCVEYHFTDISRKFILDFEHSIKEKCSSLVECFQLDISSSCVKQMKNQNQYDIIVGLDVVHVTPDVELTMRNLKPLLKSGGLLCLLETASLQSWQTITMGLMCNWWSFNDQWRESSPLLGLSSWIKLFECCDYKNILTFPSDPNTADSLLLLASVE